MKKILLVTILLGVLLTGCSSSDIESALLEKDDCKYFKELSSEDLGCIVYDTRTGVEYWRSGGFYNEGTLTVLVDADGKPLIYNE